MQEPNLLNLRFLDQPLGQLAYRVDRGGPVFALAFDPAFLAMGHDLSPLHLPLATLSSSPRLFRPGDTPFAGGLPGLLADSLPDSWGERMLRSELPGLRTIPGKLAAIGRRGFGAITYDPVLGGGDDQVGLNANLAALAKEATALMASPLTEETVVGRIKQALTAGGTLGGAQPKISAHLPLTRRHLSVKDVLIGGPTPAGYLPCLVKLTHLPEEATGAVEFAYWLMARKAGIRVPEAALVFDGKQHHFACARFDRRRNADGEIVRRHCHTLSGMLHRRAADAAIDYEDFIRLTRTLTASRQEAAECFRRGVFNLLALNRDDHGRNHAFLYNEGTREWSLAPVYDLNPSVANVLIGLSWLHRSELPDNFAQLQRLAEIGGLTAKEARAIFAEVADATVGGWRVSAKEAEVPSTIAELWEKEMFKQTKTLRQDAHSKAARHTSAENAAPLPKATPAIKPRKPSRSR